MELTGFSAQYREMADEELLKIHFDSADLTDEARFALSAELHARGLDKAETFEVFAKEEKQRRKDEELERVRMDVRKLARSRHGKSDYHFDPETGIETFATTLFFDISGIPLFPTGTYRVEKKKGWRYDYRVIEKLPLDWEQVLSVWVVTAAIALAIILIFKFVVIPRALGH